MFTDNYSPSPGLDLWGGGLNPLAKKTTPPICIDYVFQSYKQCEPPDKFGQIQPCFSQPSILPLLRHWVAPSIAAVRLIDVAGNVQLLQ